MRQVTHRFNERMPSADPQSAGGRPRQINDEDEAFIGTTANTRPIDLGRLFTRWSIRNAHLDNLSADKCFTIRQGGPEVGPCSNADAMQPGADRGMSRPATECRDRRMHLPAARPRRRNANARHPDILAAPTPRTRPHEQPTEHRWRQPMPPEPPNQPGHRWWSRHQLLSTLILWQSRG